MSRLQSGIVFALFFLVAGIAAVVYMQAQALRLLQTNVASLQAATSKSNPIPNESTLATATGSANADAPLSSRLDQLTARVDALEDRPTPSPATAVAAKPQAFQKQILTLGSWSTIRQEWTQTGLEITINSDEYPDTVNATFEAGLNIVNGLAWARLTNKSTGAIINLTEVSSDSNSVTWKSSPVFKLHPGSYTYVVELKSSSGEVAYLSNSRLIFDD